MKISIILPYYNEEKTIALTLGCLKNQTYKADEVIFVDSGSTDKTSDIINQSLINNPELNFKNILCGKRCTSETINLGIKESRYEYIMYMDCGLYIPPNWVESQMNKSIESNGDIISGRIYTEGINVIDKSFIAHTYGYKNKCICLTGSLIKKSIYKDMGYFADNMRSGYDVDFINRSKQKSYKRIVNKNIYLKYYDVNFAATILDGYNKTKLYSKTGWKASGDIKPYLYLLIIAIILSAVFFLHINYSIILFISYLVLRGYAIPFYKSKKVFEGLNKYFFIMLPLIAIVFDLARINGYIDGLIKR